MFTNPLLLIVFVLLVIALGVQTNKRIQRLERLVHLLARARAKHQSGYVAQGMGSLPRVDFVKSS